MNTPKTVLIIGAMETELRHLIAKLNAKPSTKLHNHYPTFTSQLSPTTTVHIVESYVGDLNASLSSTLALEAFQPNYVFKLGCIGGNSAGLHQNDIILPEGYFHSTSWITRSHHDNNPTSDSSLWQSVFGDLPYQVNSANLGN